ncbi:MAG: AMP-binding protein [Planctomycetota bacterium]
MSFEPDVSRQADVGSRFDAVADASPQSLAVASDAAQVTYSRLRERSNGVAHRIVQELGSHEECVALWLPHGAEVFAALLGVVKAGKYYTVVDPQWPDAQVRSVLRDCGARWLLCDDKSADRAQTLRPRSMQCVPLSDCDAPQSTAPALELPPQRAALLLYSSGTTGEPKGILHQHDSILACAAKYATGLAVAATDRVALLMRCSFGASVGDLFSTLLMGATVCPFDARERSPQDLWRWLRDNRVTIYHSVPTLLRRLAAQSAGELPAVRLVRVGGEPVDRRDLAAVDTAFSKSAQLCISYGASEALGICSSFVDRTHPPEAEPFSVGIAQAGTEVLLVDELLRPVAPGNSGEVVVGGAGLARGYLASDATDDRFLAAGVCLETRCFRTGDLGSWSSDGQLLLAGRIDAQLKIRGVRVEAEAIAATIHTLSSVAEAVVVPWGESALVAYFVPTAPGAASVTEMREAVRSRFPEEMQPAAFVALEALPLLANGKLDRAALPPPRPKSEAVGADRLPRSAREARLLALWREVLDCPAAVITDDFFELGGSSVAAARLFARISEEFGVDLPLATLFAAPSVAALAPMVFEEAAAPQWDHLVPVQSNGDQSPLFVVHGAGGNVLSYRFLAHALGEQQPVFGLQAPGLDGSPVVAKTLEEVAATYVTELCQCQPRGPYWLAGYSAGGWFAYEMARQLRQQGAVVGRVFLLDTLIPDPSRRPGAALAAGSRWRRLRNYPRRLLENWRLRRYWRTRRRVPHRLRQQHVFQTNVALSRGYRPRPCDVSVTLLAAAPVPAELADRWRQLIGDRLEIVVVAGRHDGVMRDETAPQWAAEIALRLGGDGSH